MRNTALQYVFSSSLLWMTLLVTIYCEPRGNGNVRDKKEWSQRLTTTKKVDLSENNTHKSYTMRPHVQREKTILEGNSSNEINDNPSRSDLPLPIMIASPAVAIGIVIFICVAYKWHTKQLDTQAKDLALQMAANCPSPCIPCSPCHNTQRLLSPSPLICPATPSHSDTDLLAARRKSMLSSSSIRLSPPGIANKRGSSWSGLTDQEILNHSPRRHSAFLL